jgi:GGDEF domain-containing protein
MPEQHEQALADGKLALELSSRVPHRAIELAKSAIEFSNPGDYQTSAYALAAFGSAYACLGRREDALKYLHDAMGVAFELRLTYVMGRIHQTRGWLSLEEGKPVEAFGDWQSALEYFRQVRDMRGIAWILMHYAESYSTLGLLDHAIRCRISALEIVDQLGDRESEDDLRVSLAQVYVRRAWARNQVGETGYALVDAQIGTSLLLRILEQRSSELSPNSYEAAFRALGEAFLLQNRPLDAMANFKQAAEASTRLGGFRTEARIQGLIGYTRFLLGDVSAAKDQIVAAIIHAPASTSSDDLACLHQWLAEVCENSDDYQGAIRALWKALEFDKQIQIQRSDYWAHMHDFTIGLNETLLDDSQVMLHETGWTYSEDQVRAHCGHLSLISNVDSQTGALNRTEFMTQLKRIESPTVAVFDVRNLDIINGRFGRKVGDEVLSRVASAISVGLPTGSLVGRYSGSEFIVASQDISPERFENALAAIEGFPWMAVDPDLVVRVDLRFVRPDKPFLLAS